MATRELTADEFDDIDDTIGERGKYERVVKPFVTDERRWVNGYETVIRERSSGKLFILEFYRGNSEISQDGFSYEDYPASLTDAEAYEVTETKYRAVPA